MEAKHGPDALSEAFKRWPVECIPGNRIVAKAHDPRNSPKKGRIMTGDRAPQRKLAFIAKLGIGRAVAQALAGDDGNRSPVVRIERPEPFPVDVRVRIDPPRKDWEQRERRRPRHR